MSQRNALPTCPQCHTRPVRRDAHGHIRKYCSTECFQARRRARLRELAAEKLERARAEFGGPAQKCPNCKAIKPSTAFFSKLGRPTKSCDTCRAKAATYTTPEQRRDQNLRNLYGLSAAEYDAMFSRQRGLCAICGFPETVVRYGAIARLHVDHCHDTGKVRGLLCAACNAGIGQMREDPVRLRAAIEYLELHKELRP